MYSDRWSRNPILKLSFEFSLQIISFCEKLELKQKYALANQLFRSGTSVGANISEAQNAESRADFLHKFKIAAKEAGETEYWLLLCAYSGNYRECEELLEKLKTLHKLIGKIIISTKHKTR